MPPYIEVVFKVGFTVLHNKQDTDFHLPTSEANRALNNLTLLHSGWIYSLFVIV